MTNWGTQLKNILIDKTTYTNVSSYESYPSVGDMPAPTNGVPTIFINFPSEVNREGKVLIIHYPIDVICYDLGDVEALYMKMLLASSEFTTTGWNKDIDTIEGESLTTYPFFIDVKPQLYFYADSIYQCWFSIEVRWNIT